MSKLTVIIKTREDDKEITKQYQYEGSLNIPVTTLLERINHQYDTRIHYSSSCLQGLCGSCAMLINGWPKLACKTFIDEEIMTRQFNRITIAPLSKFPVIKDLVIDRSKIHQSMIEAQQWLEENAKIDVKHIAFEYEVSQCVMCGCCLEACSNYNHDDNFYGVVLPVSSSKITRQEQDKQRKSQHNRIYNDHFYKYCVKSLV